MNFCGIQVARKTALPRRARPGNFLFAIDDLTDAGIEVLNPIQPECNDLRRIKEKYGDRFSFWGGIGVQSEMPHGTPEDVRRAVRETSAILGRDGGLLLAPAHILDLSVPWEHVEAFIDAARRVGD